MEEKELLKMNKKLYEKLHTLEIKINKLALERNEIENEIEPPCIFCKYDGLYRCEACHEDEYKGFNIKNYPRE